MPGLPAHLFRRIPPPSSDVEAQAQWFTWSARARETLSSLAHHHLPRPRVTYFQNTEYGYTLQSKARELVPLELRRRLDALAAAFLRIDCGDRLFLFDNLIGGSIDGRCLQSFFAWVCARIVEITRDPQAAIYAPLGAVGGTAQGDFPLHADLYAPVHLLNVFDEVPADGSGEALLLPAGHLFRCVDELRSMPARARQRVQQLLCEASNTDHYEEFYNLLHGPHRWTSKLESAMTATALRVALTRGQGYMVHDRRWLHGRMAPSSRVRKNRLHRIIFDNTDSLQQRLAAVAGH